jgi:hypothetical protein
MKIWSKAPDGCFIPRQIGRLIVGRNMTLTLTVVGYSPHSHNTSAEAKKFLLLRSITGKRRIKTDEKA